MRAIRMTAPRKMKIVELPDPVPGPSEVLVRMKEIAVCGSDLVPYLGTHPFVYPIPDGQPSHECVGIVEWSGMEGYTQGDRVLYFPPDSDGLRELVVATDPVQLLKLPAEGDITHWMMAQLLGTVIHSADRIGSFMGQSVAIIGQGPVGQLWNALLRNLGARTIIGIDKVPERLELSNVMGATHTLLNDGDDIGDRVRELTRGLGADVVVEAAGYNEAHRLMFDLVRQDGRICMFGHPKPLESEIPIYEWYKKRAQVITHWGPDVENEIGLALEFIQQGRIDIRPLLTHRFPFEKVQEAFELFTERRDSCIKVIVEFS
jgi:threonine dehydrogenase-like Zn-dependent dehydrogenase